MFYWIDNELDPALSDGVQDLRSWVQGAGKYNLLVHFFYCSFIPSFISLIKNISWGVHSRQEGLGKVRWNHGLNFSTILFQG
jgi:hypothetical protein